MSTLPPQPRRKRFVPKYEVEGVIKVTLSEETQLLIDVVIGTHVTSQDPWKYVSKAKLLESIDISGENSEFYPIKEQLEAYVDEKVLLGYIPDESKDIDEFYVCYTPQARDHCKEQSDRFIKRQQKKLDKAVSKKSRPWNSLGSEGEINELKPVNTRPLIELELHTKFPTVYQPDKFRIRDTNSVRDGYVELTPYRVKYNNVYRRRVDNATQAAPGRIENVAQTLLRYPQNMWTQSIADALGKVQEDADAGGDTNVVVKKNDKSDSSEDEQENFNNKKDSEDPGLAAYKATLKKMRRPSYINKIKNFVTSCRNEMDDIIELNTVMDMYFDDYPSLVTIKVSDIYSSMTFEQYICFTDVRAKSKYVSSAVFHPMWTGIVAIAYTDGSPSVMKTISVRPDPVKRAVYGLNPVMIWSHIDSLLPKLYLESPREVKTLSFCPFDENILIGGCINGQIIIWDITNKLENVETIEVLSETREKYRIAMNAHMDWMKNVQDKSVVQYTAMSNIMYSHYGSVTSIQWLSPNFAITPTGKHVVTQNSKMIFTGSEDGTILIWNLSLDNVDKSDGKKVKKSKRIFKKPSGLLVDISPLKVLDRNSQPCFKIILGRAGQPFILPLQDFSLEKANIKYIYEPKNSESGRKYFTYEVMPQTEDMSKILYCGSLHGEIRRISWEGHEFNTGEVVGSQYCDINYSVYIHDGVITACIQNPFIANITLTVGGKIFAIWSDNLSSRPLIWKKRPYRLTDASWSNYKSSILFITTSEGSLETWDILVRSDKPIAIQTISGTMLTNVCLHTLPLSKNIIGIADANGSFRMMIVPPIFMIENSSYEKEMESLINRELKVMLSFIKWQDDWMKNNPHILQEMRRKEGALLAEKEEQKRRLREEEEKRLEEEAEALRKEKMRVIGPEEKWQQIIQKLIERTIAVKKRINRAELIEHERPLRELEAQRLEKERRMLEIMKNQKTIFNDTVAILFPEAIKKKEKEKKSLLTDNKENLKKEYLEDYDSYVKSAWNMVTQNPYHADFSWESTLAEGKERRQSLHINEYFMRLHRSRIDEEATGVVNPPISRHVLTAPIDIEPNQFPSN